MKVRHLERSARPRGRRLRRAVSVAFVLVALGASEARPAPKTLAQQNEELFARMHLELGLSDGQMAEVRKIFGQSRFLGQGNPAITVHPMTPDECRQRVAADPQRGRDDDEFESICGAKLMAPLYDPARERAADARACIDRYEFPNLPCAYPVVWVRAREAAELCTAVGKRLCDAHEWESACAGSLREPDYRFDLAAGVAPPVAVARMRAASNRLEDGRMLWSYGAEYRSGVCATGGAKSAGCNGGGWQSCGSNTYPAGAFPACRSSLGVYDLHGNAAEHMNLPLAPDQMASRGSAELGVTEMKGSWFIFDRYKAHEDACRWRAPYWHGGRVMDRGSHHNYHLGFRCCKSLPASPPSQ
jgi:formylglycine-generating enzyme required for sulfatase activity